MTMQHHPTFTVNQLLHLLEAHLQQQGPEAGNSNVQLLPEGLVFGQSSRVPAYRTGPSVSGVLSALEQQRLQVLDRKAKGGWLTPQEDAEFEQLLQLQGSRGFAEPVVRGKAA